MLKKKSIALLFSIATVVAILIGLTLWTLTSPAPLAVQSPSSLKSGLFSLSYTTAGYNVSDASGFYSFKFGLEYDRSVSNGSASELVVYCALVGERISSPFTKGVALTLVSSTISLDGSSVFGSKPNSRMQSGLCSYYFGTQHLESSSSGNQTLEVKLVLSTNDIDVIGNSLGNYFVVALNGTMNIQV